MDAKTKDIAYWKSFIEYYNYNVYQLHFPDKQYDKTTFLAKNIENEDVFIEFSVDENYLPLHILLKECTGNRFDRKFKILVEQNLPSDSDLNKILTHTFSIVSQEKRSIEYWKSLLEKYNWITYKVHFPEIEGYREIILFAYKKEIPDLFFELGLSPVFIPSYINIEKGIGLNYGELLSIDYPDKQQIEDALTLNFELPNEE